MRVLLVAAGLCMGANAWADPETIYMKTLSDWSSDDATTTEGTVSKWYNSTGISSSENNTGILIDAEKGFGINASRTTATAQLKLNRTANTVVTLDAVWNVGNSTNDANTPYNMFTYGGLTIKQNVRSNNHTTSYTINNGSSITIGTDKFASNDAMTIHLKVNSVSGELSEFYIKNGETTVLQLSDLTEANKTFAAGTNYDNVIITAVAPATSGGQRARNYMTSITVQQETQDVETADVTVKYTDTAGNSLSSIKPDYTYKDVQTGTSISSLVTEAIKATFKNGDETIKYVFDSYTCADETVPAEGTIITVKFTPNAKYTATVRSICGTNEIADITGSWYADETPVTLYWPKVISCTDGYYIISAQAEEPLYGYTFSTSDLTKTVAYSLDEDIVYYAEYENILTDKNSYEYFPEKASKGASRCIQKSGVMKTNMNLAAAGVYDVIIAGGNRDASHTTTLELKLIASDNTISTENVITKDFTSGQWVGEMTATKVTIPAGSELYVANDNGTGNAKFAGDYIIVRKSNASVTVTSAGWATLYTPYALDFSSPRESLAAYTATCSESTVTLTKVNNVPAGTGVVLKAAEGTYSIPVIASSTTDKGHLLGSATEATAFDAYDGYTLYMLKMVGENAQFVPMTSGSLAAGKAYLKISSGNSSLARSLNVVFADEATGINSVNSDEVTVNGYFNLSGQRVSQPTKGLYIVNGKKVIVK